MPRHFTPKRLSRLLLWGFGAVLVLYSAVWEPCHNGYSQSEDIDTSHYIPGSGFDIPSGEDPEEMRTYTVVDGLVGPVVPVIFQDSRGALWFGSEIGGVSRFDGQTFEKFRFKDELSLGVTRQILEDRWGHIWFLTQLGDEGIVSYFNGINIEKVEATTCMILDNNGDIWTADNQGLRHYTSYVSSAYGSAYYPLQEITNTTINVLFQSKDGSFWIGGSTAGSILILSFDPNSSEFKDETVDRAKFTPALASTDSTFAIHDIAEGPYGVEHLWFAGPNLLLRFDREKFHQIPNPQSINQSHIQAKKRNDIVLHHDRFHNRIWFSNQGSVIWSDGNTPKKLPQFHEEFPGILKTQETWGALWVASSTGAYRYDPEHSVSDHPPTKYTVEDGLGSDNIQTIFQAADGKIWFGHDNGVTVFNPQSTFVNFRTRPILGNDSVRRHRIYEDSFGGIWFSIPGGIARYEEGKLYQRKLLLKQDMPQEPQLKPQVKEDQNNDVPKFKTSERDVEIVKIFQHQGWIWLISRPKQKSTEILYTLFAKALRENKGFKQLTIRVQTETGHGSPPEVLISGPKDPYIAFGGWLFKPNSEGLKRLSPQGTRPFPFRESTPFEDLPMIKHGPSPIVAMRVTHGEILCYRKDGISQPYPNRENTVEIQLKSLQRSNPKIISKDSSEETAPKWFFNSQKKQIIYWDIEKPNEPTTIEGDFDTPPRAIWKSADRKKTTFIFSDRLMKYRGTQYRGTQLTDDDGDKINVAEVNAALLTDAQVLWLATKHGAVRYNGDTLKTYGVKEGLLVNDLRDVGEDTMGHIWFATWGGGAARYDGETFTSEGTGVTNRQESAVRYDGKPFTPVTTRNGLAHNNVSDIHQSRDGYIWFATQGGVTRYSPMDGALPFCRITKVNDKTETPLVFPSHVNDLTFNVEGTNPLRLRHQLTYEFKLLGFGENDWTRTSPTTSTDTPMPRGNPSVTYQGFKPAVTYQGFKPGNYTFLVKTYRKGWPYTSAPAAVNFTIAAPFWTQWRSYLPYLIIGVLLIAIVPYLLARLLVNRRRVARLHAEMQQKEEADMQQLRAELDKARNMQEALLPTEVPEVEGFDVAGMSLPATQVGGDFYDYLNVGEKHLVIAVTDAAGKGLRGALNAVLTNGMLNEIVQIQDSADVILTNLNTSLVPRLYGRTFIALNLAIIDTENAQILYANAGQPYPILKRGDTLVEIETSELPLGGMKGIEYGQEQLELAPGDIYIFYSDGVIEALNSEEEMYGTERLKSVLAEAPQHLSAEELIEYTFKDIQAFVQTAEQYDDITIVVVRHQPPTQ